MKGPTVIHLLDGGGTLEIPEGMTIELPDATWEFTSPHTACEEKIAALMVECQSLREDRERIRADLHRAAHRIEELETITELDEYDDDTIRVGPTPPSGVASTSVE